MKWIRVALNLIISAFFVVSAVGKLMSMDAFEIYLYRVSFLDYDAATVAARLVISAELIFAFGFLTRLRYRLVWWFTFLAMLGFSVFLAFQFFDGDESNCFCLGELMDLSPGESLLKNVVLLGLLGLVYKSAQWRFSFSNWVFAAALAAGVAVPLATAPPDIFVSGRFNAAEHDQNALIEALDQGTIPLEFVEGKKLLSFYSTGCKFCQMSATRIGALAKKSTLDTADCRIVFWGDSTVNAEGFFQKTNSPALTHTSLTTAPYLEITKGRMPLTLLVEDGVVKHQYNYRTLDEQKILDFFRKED